MLAAAALGALAGCPYGGPCELAPEFSTPTKINLAPWIYTRGNGSGGDAYIQFVVTGVSAEVSADFKTKCWASDWRLAEAKATVRLPSGREERAKLRFTQRHIPPADPNPLPGEPLQDLRPAVDGRLIYAPSENGLHEATLDFGKEGVFKRQFLVSQIHSWDEMTTVLPGYCRSVERTRLGTWLCDNVAYSGSGLRREFPASSVVRTDGSNVYVWGDTSLAVWTEDSAGAWTLKSSAAIQSSLGERHQLLLQRGRALLVSSTTTRLYEWSGGALALKAVGPTPIANVPVPVPNVQENAWGVSFDGDNILLAELQLNPGDVNLCLLDAAASFAPRNCTVIDGTPGAVNPEGVWITWGSFNVARLYGVDGGVVVQRHEVWDTFELPGLFTGSSLSSPGRETDGGFGVGARRSLTSHPSNNTCGIPVVQPDGVFVNHVFPEENLDYAWGTWCDASADFVWYWSADRTKSETFVFPW